MSSVELMMLKSRIEEISSDISKYADLSRDALFTDCVDRKLKATLARYIDIINLDEKELRTKSSIRVIKAVTRMQHEEDKKRILEEAKEK